MIMIRRLQEYEKKNHQPTGRERAEQLMKFHWDDVIREIFDISGGDIANEILLGTFTTMEKEEGTLEVCELVKYFAGSNLPIAKTQLIGHGEDSKAVIIGRYLKLSEGK